MKIGNIEKPSFNKIREDFILFVEQVTSLKVGSENLWREIGDSEVRDRIIKDFIRQMEQQYALEIVLKSPLADKEGSVEGVVGELYHIFSTMFLVEAINYKIRAGEKRVEV